MGDRASFIVHNRSHKSFGTQPPQYSPEVYGHYAGEKAPAIIAELHALMDGRRGDVPYACARLIGILHVATPGNLSLGVSNLPDDFSYDVQYLIDRSPGDGGLILYDCVSGEVEVYDGYLTSDDFKHVNL